MNIKPHRYQADIAWTGNLATGTTNYGSYARDHVVRAVGKPDIRLLMRISLHRYRR